MRKETMRNDEKKKWKKKRNDEKNKLESILIDYEKSVNPVPVGKSKIPYKHEINLTDDVPIVAQPRVLPHWKKQQIYDQIQQILNDEIIQPSDSPYPAGTQYSGNIRWVFSQRCNVRDIQGIFREHLKGKELLIQKLFLC